MCSRVNEFGKGGHRMCDLLHDHQQACRFSQELLLIYLHNPSKTLFMKHRLSILSRHFIVSKFPYQSRCSSSAELLQQCAVTKRNPFSSEERCEGVRKCRSKKVTPVKGGLGTGRLLRVDEGTNACQDPGSVHNSVHYALL